MAPRKTTKNPSQAISEAIDAKPENNLYDLAVGLGITLGELRERLSAKLDNSDPLDWETVPTEHEPLLKLIANEVEAGKTLQLNAAEAPVMPDLPQETEIPLMPVEPPKNRKKRGGALANRGKKASTQLTQQKSEEIEQIREDSTQINNGIAETLIEFTAKEGLQDSANAATAYGAAFKTNLDNKKGEVALSIATEILFRTADKQIFSPNTVLDRLGVPLSAQTRQELEEDLAEISGELQAATEEIVTTSWGNGQSPKDALTRLRELRKLNS